MGSCPGIDLNFRAAWCMQPRDLRIQARTSETGRHMPCDLGRPCMIALASLLPATEGRLSGGTRCLEPEVVAIRCGKRRTPRCRALRRWTAAQRVVCRGRAEQAEGECHLE